MYYAKYQGPTSAIADAAENRFANQNDEKEMTLSIAAWDRETGQLGAAISSSSISVASRCLHWSPGIGIALSQNITDPRLGPRLLSLLEEGIEVGAAIDSVT